MGKGDAAYYALDLNDVLPSHSVHGKKRWHVRENVWVSLSLSFRSLAARPLTCCFACSSEFSQCGLSMSTLLCLLGDVWLPPVEIKITLRHGPPVQAVPSWNRRLKYLLGICGVVLATVFAVNIFRPTCTELPTVCGPDSLLSIDARSPACMRDLRPGRMMLQLMPRCPASPSMKMSTSLEAEVAAGAHPIPVRRLCSLVPRAQDSARALPRACSV